MQTDAALPDETTASEAMRTADCDTPTEPDAPAAVNEDAPPAEAREKLPDTYRSRHDRHHAEHLTSPAGMPLLRMLAVSRIDAAHLPDPADVAALTSSIARLGVLQPLLVRAAGDRFVLIAGRRRLVAAREARCREVPCLVHTVDEARALDLAEAANGPVGERRERIPRGESLQAAPSGCDALTDAMLPEIEHALTSVHRSLRLLPQTPPATRERVGMRLAAAELERARWLVRCRRYLAGRIAIFLRPVTPADLARDLAAVGAGVTLHGGELEVDMTRAPAAVIADAALLAAAVRGLAWALLALGETARDPRLRVSLTRGAAAALSIATPTAVLDEAMVLRFFESGWRPRPGGTSSELAVHLARYAAARHGADLEVSSGSATGTRVTLSLH